MASNAATWPALARAVNRAHGPERGDWRALAKAVNRAHGPERGALPSPCDTLPLALGPERGDVAGPGEGGESRSWHRTRRLGGRWREVGSRSGDERRSDPSAPPRPIKCRCCSLSDQSAERLRLSGGDPAARDGGRGSMSWGGRTGHRPLEPTVRRRGSRQIGWRKRLDEPPRGRRFRLGTDSEWASRLVAEPLRRRTPIGHVWWAGRACGGSLAFVPAGVEVAGAIGSLLDHDHVGAVVAPRHYELDRLPAGSTWADPLPFEDPRVGRVELVGVGIARVGAAA